MDILVQIASAVGISQPPEVQLMEAVRTVVNEQLPLGIVWLNVDPSFDYGGPSDNQHVFQVGVPKPCMHCNA
mgnify:CR=1 FL=1